MTSTTTAMILIKRRKQILRAPESEYRALYPQSDAEALQAIKDLHQRYLDITQQLKDAQVQSKKISRHIGEARREGHSCDELLQDMQQHSASSKQLKQTQAELSESILQYFVADDIASSPVTTSSLPPARSHAESVTSASDTTIALMTDDNDAWNRYVTSNPGASLYHRSEWKPLIEDVFGHTCYYLYAKQHDKIVGLLPLVRLNSRLFGDFMVSMPYFNSGGAIADSLRLEKQLMQAAEEKAEQLGCSHIEYRDDIPRDGYPVRDEKVNMILPLPQTSEDLWDSFSSKLRAQIRRPQRENVSVSLGGIDHLDEFYAVFAHNMRDLGTPVYGKSFFRHILQSFPDSSKLVVIRLNGRAVACAFLLGHNDILEIPWASTIKNVNHLSMNMLLYWEVLKFAVSGPYHYFDFGRSSKDSGTYRFKQQWGAIAKPCYWHYWLKDGGELPALNPNNPKYRLLIALWKKMPIWLTKCIGPGIVKNLP